MDSGCIHFYFGDGKGKTTAAMGLALRALGQGLPVMIAQFLKDGSSGECAVLAKMGATLVSGKASPLFYSKMSEIEKSETKHIHDAHLITASSFVGAPGLFVLDEIGDAVELGAVSTQLLYDLLTRRGQTEIVMTGHSPIKALLELAHYQTEMKLHRHPFADGLPARRGIEY